MNYRYREKQSPSNMKKKGYGVEVIKIKFNAKVVFKVHKQSFVVVLQKGHS